MTVPVVGALEVVLGAGLLLGRRMPIILSAVALVAMEWPAWPLEDPSITAPTSQPGPTGIPVYTCIRWVDRAEGRNRFERGAQA